MTLRVVQDVEEFYVPPLPPVDSAQFTEEIKEVRRIGRADSTNRTAYQTDMAIAFANINDQMVLGLVKYAQDRGFDRRQSAALYHVAATSGFEAHVLTHYWKTVYLYPRPSLVIWTGPQNSTVDLQPEIEPDQTWLPMGDITPSNAEYPSGTVGLESGTFGAIKNMDGNNHRIGLIYPRPSGLGDIPVPFEFPTIQDAMEGGIMGRIARGFQFRSTGEKGLSLGERVSAAVVERMCPNGRCLDKDNPKLIPYQYRR
eukprot:gb/GECH01009898.1/.p1 GENE.gb/GECH01009898.1/~~gb/GECH01009898.1/.p1  ORF type:complete len:256 (+),score=30.70 gb/GECH01009898.1/:1-768(+)